MKHIIDLNWKGKMEFQTEIEGHKLTIDAPVEGGGEDHGLRPKRLMLVALAGCSGMDVVSILAKMHVELSFFNVKVEGEVTEEHPKHYEAMKIIYEFKGLNLDLSKLEKAVNMSIDKYCGVAAVYKKVVDFSYEIKILE